MTEHTLEVALGSLVNFAQFYVARLEPIPNTTKFKKTPCYPDGSVYIMDAALPQNWLSYTDANATRIMLEMRGDGYRYALAFYLTPNLKKWFLDVDNCVNNDGTLNATGLYYWQYYTQRGCLVEWSSSCKGLHIIGSGEIPEHSCTSAESKAIGLELYHEKRSITFGLTGMAWGNADTIATPPLEYFPPIDRGTVGEFDSGPRDDWKGPIDDDELIRRALASRSVASQFGNKASFADLWNHNVPVLATTYPDPGNAAGYGGNEADQALAQHLAFWTGCDAERIERLMRRSGLMRDKWDTHGTYLRELTIARACAMQADVCCDKETVQKLDVAVSPEQSNVAHDWIGKILAAEELVLRNEIIPAIAADRSIHTLDRDRLAALLKERFAAFGIPTTISMCRNMLKMQAIKSDEDDSSAAVPTFAQDNVYVLSQDCFFNLQNASVASRSGFNAQFNRLMPLRGNGDREDAAKWCLERWGTRTIDELMYCPGRECIFNYGGKWFANRFTPQSIPTIATAYTDRGVAAIEKFLKVLWHICGEREDVYTMLASWIAFSVQHPGTKIRFSPLIKGVEGDGKSIIASVLRSAMGVRNVRSVGPSIIANSGGFTEWAEGYAVVALEEIMLSGGDRYRIYNAVKEFISNSFVSINPKGRASFDIINSTNYIGFTNHANAIPLGNTDRRWWVIFTPFDRVEQLAEKLNLSGAVALNEYFGQIFDSLLADVGEWRKFFMEYAIAREFNPNAHAPFTEEKELMQSNGEDEYDAIARQIIAEGSEGITRDVLSASCLSVRLRSVAMLDGMDPPQTWAFHHMLLRLGYIQITRVKWRGKVHRIWAKGFGKLSNDRIREILDGSGVTTVRHLQLLGTPPVTSVSD